MDYRRQHHTPLFEREVESQRAPFLVEWWIHAQEDLNVVPNGGAPVQPYLLKNRVYLPAGARFLEGMLTMMEQDSRLRLGTLNRPWAEWARYNWSQTMDVGIGIPKSKVRHEVLVKTIIPWKEIEEGALGALLSEAAMVPRALTEARARLS